MHAYTHRGHIIQIKVNAATSERVDNTVAWTGFGDLRRTNNAAASNSDNPAAPMVRTIATELTKMTPS